MLFEPMFQLGCLLTCVCKYNDNINNFLKSFIVALTIGFERPIYTFNEPKNRVLIMEVALVKANNRSSEQTFTVAVFISDPTLPGINPATTGTTEALIDYTIEGGGSNGFRTLLFPPNAERIQYKISLYPDEIYEGSEGFLALSSPLEGSITYTPPNIMSGVYRSATIVIEENVSKCNCSFEV